MASTKEQFAANIVQVLQNEMGPTPITPDEYYDYADSVLPKT